MGRVIYCMNVSLDGFVATSDGDLGWADVGPELHAWFNDQLRSMDASLYGRRIYQTMAAYWPTAEHDPEAAPEELDFARIWNRLPKVVFSRSLREVLPGCRLVQGDVREVLADIRRDHPGDIDVSGPDLAGQFLRADLVDEVIPVVHPVALGAGKRFWPDLPAPLPYRLAGSTTMRSGVVALRYVRADRPA
jgi:dihydrofolate reductase